MDESNAKRKELLGKNYRIARDYADLLGHPGFIHLKEQLEGDIDAVIEHAIHRSWVSNDLEHEKLVEVRVIRGMLDNVIQIASKVDKLKEQLAEIGVSIDLKM
jgi:hypothetical protein